MTLGIWHCLRPCRAQFKVYQIILSRSTALSDKRNALHSREDRTSESVDETIAKMQHDDRQEDCESSSAFILLRTGTSL